MDKSDSILRDITIASIKRHTIIPHDWLYSRFYEEEQINDLGLIKIDLDFSEGELPVASMIKDSENWTFVTTRKIIGKADSHKSKIEIKHLEHVNWVVAQNRKVQSIQIEFHSTNKQIIKFIIETGKASMVMIDALQTLKQLIKS